MPKVLYIVLLAVALNGVRTGTVSNVCSTYCDDSHIASVYCTNSRSCVERVRKNQIIEVFARKETNCYRERIPVFPAYIESISVWVRNETLSVNVSWQWPAVDVTDNHNGYEIEWGLQYSLTILGEIRSNCYSISLSKHDIQQGRLSIPCMKFEHDSYSRTVEFHITSLAFLTEKFRSGSSFIPSRLQEITVKADMLNNASSIQIWNPEMSYQFSDHGLQVSFIPAPHSLGHTSYELHIFKAEESKCIPNGPYIDKVDTVPYWPRTHVNFSTEKFEECSEYCVGIHPIKNSSHTHCSEGCVPEMHDMLLLQVPSRTLKCIDWNANFIVSVDAFQSKVTVSFTVWPEYDFCFKKFRMFLFSPLKSVCKVPGTVIALKAFQWNSSETIVTFEGIQPGNYCVRVIPQHEACRRKNTNICSLLYSDIHHFPELPTAASSLKTPDPPAFSPVIMISVITVIGVVILVTVGGILWRKSRPPPTVISINGISCGEGSGLLDALYSNAPRKIIILYTHDQQTRTEARALAHFLEKCRGYQVFLDEDNRAQIFAGNPCIIPEIIGFNCPQNKGNNNHDENKRIIVVKSRRAAKLFRTQEIIMKAIMGSNSGNNRNFDSSRPSHNNVKLNQGHDENMSLNEEEPSNIYRRLDELFFCPAITSIPNFTNSLMDTCHIFVVQFGEKDVPECETYRLLTPGQRYCLPIHLGELCLNLERTDHPTDATVRSRRINEMHQQWEEHASYRELVRVCS